LGRFAAQTPPFPIRRQSGEPRDHCRRDCKLP
jgi:hypothetical protein